jgi:DNA ligase (NAD+)
VEKFKSTSVVITGTFFRYDREVLKQAIKKAGAKVGTGVTAKTNHLLAGQKPGAQKVDKATELKIPILEEDDLIKLLD